MAQDSQTIIQEIMGYIGTYGGVGSAWYIGIATSPRQRLFNDHNVTEQGGAWIYRDAGSAGVARSIEEHLINRLRAKGDTGGGDDSTRHVYAYKVTSSTIE